MQNKRLFFLIFGIVSAIAGLVLLTVWFGWKGLLVASLLSLANNITRKDELNEKLKE